MEETEGTTGDLESAQIEARIVELRDAGTSWNEIERTFGFNRQQARYHYQVGKRAIRREKRRENR